jgi:hypothetical protein
VSSARRRSGRTEAPTEPHDAVEDTTEDAPPYRGVVIIEWPASVGTGPYACMVGHAITITDAVTGKLITTCTSSDVTVHADANSLVTANLTLFADADGEPLLEGGPVIGDEEILTGTFPFLVAEMRVRGKSE